MKTHNTKLCWLPAMLIGLSVAPVYAQLAPPPSSLGPTPNWNAKAGEAGSLAPQPSPPKTAPNWNSVKPGDVGSLNSRPPPTTVAPGAGAPTVSNRAAGMIVERVGAIAARRLRAAGLDPASPAFRGQVDERLQRFATALQKLAIAPPARQHVADLVRSKVGARAALGQMQSAVNRVSPTPASASAGVLDTLPLFALADYRVPSGPLPMPMFYVIPFLRPVGHARAISANDSASVRFVIPACGLDATHSVNILRAEELGPTLDELKAANPGWHFDGREFAIFITFDDMSDEGFPLGATPRHGALTLTVNGLSSTSSWDFAASPIAYAWSAAVGVDAPFLGANSLGLTAANAIFGQSTVRRVNLGDQPMEGQDVLGSGIQLGAGYVAQAQVVSAHSIADLGGDASPDNQYRGAAVTIQPQSNRFQTTVKWHIGPGDSLQYAITWNLTGPDGQRPLLSMPKRGACDS